MKDLRACEHEFEFSSDIDEPDMKCDKCKEPLEIISSIELDRLRSIPAPLVWTKEKPKVAGLYWHRNGESAGSCSVYMAVSGFLAHFNGASRPSFVAEIEGEWAGPIPQPGSNTPKGAE